MVKREEWPLLFFTMLSQLAVGTFFMLVLVKSSMSTENPALANQMIGLGIYAVIAIMALAMGCSLFHLGQPFLAYKSILNARSSRLSREIYRQAFICFLLWGMLSPASPAKQCRLSAGSDGCRTGQHLQYGEIYRATVFPIGTMSKIL
jgi:DMSO reductase anchor subunit